MPEELDGQLNSVQVRDRLLARAKADLGGADQLSFIENEYTEAFVDLAIARRGLSASQLLGQPIDLTELTQTISSMVRVGSRLASQRRQRDVSPNLDQFLDARANTVEATVVSDDADEN